MFQNVMKRRKAMSEPVQPVDKPKQEKIRALLSKELDNVVKAAISSNYTSRENIPSEITQNLCNAIEAIFIHGLKDPFFLKGTRYAKYPEPNFWPFVSKYSHKNITNQITCLRQIKSEIGKSRAWIRIVLNDNSLNHYLDLLSHEIGAIQQFYGEEAFLRYLGHNEHSERIRGILKPLGTLPIYAATNSSFLNTWTPTPLILSGLMDGNPLKVGVLKPRRNPRKGSECEETAVSAIDMLVPEEDHDIGSPKRLARMRRNTHKAKQPSDEDDNTSTYSHPSMLDSGDMSYQHALSRRNLSGPSLRPVSSNQRIKILPQSPLFTSTPVEKTILDNIETVKSSKPGPVSVNELNMEKQEPEGYEPLIVIRRTKRPSNHSTSRSSSESASNKERKSSRVVTESIRVSRSNSDMPSTIYGTVPNDAAFSLDEPDVQKSASNTMDSGICELNERRTDASLVDAINKLSTDSEPPISNDNSQIRHITFSSHFSVEMSVVDVQIVETVRAPEQSQQVESDTPPESEKLDVPAESHEQNDSILGTSLRDELLEAMPSSAQDDVFGNEFPTFVQSPALMGNSLAAIGARNHLNWETTSGRSRLSSSSESCGPVVSFGQALRSAMETGANDGFNESNCNSEPAENGDSSISSRKSSKSSSVTTEITEKLCRIPREKGLDAQDFRCSMCRKSVGGSTYSKFEVCAIDAKYYCTECMKCGGKSAIPSRVLMDWDWKERPISDRGRNWIEANQEKAFINIEERNKKLYDHVPALRETKLLREKLQLVSMYLFNCRDSIAEDFRRRVWPKEYLHADIHRYSFADLMDVKSGSLQKKLKFLLKHAVTHVMSCVLCRQKGFICELCSVNEVIYPFYVEETHRCRVCFSVFHDECWRGAIECPKCIRRKQFDDRRAQIDDPHSVLILQP